MTLEERFEVSKVFLTDSNLFGVVNDSALRIIASDMRNVPPRIFFQELLKRVIQKVQCDTYFYNYRLAVKSQKERQQKNLSKRNQKKA